MLKRTVDTFIAVLGLIMLLPLVLLVALLIKFDSAGPVFFRQRRVGLNGKPFLILKFRTMVGGAYKLGPRLTVKRDPRVTRVGQVLRWFKIDELPQLLNVVRGEMSLIGPRPEDPHFVRFYAQDQRRVLSVRPGVVGPSQILGRDELEAYPEGVKDTEAYYLQHILPDKLKRDLQYVAHSSLLGDLSLLARGLWVTARGAVKAMFLWRRRHRVALFVVDGVLVVTSCYLSFMMRFDFSASVVDQFFLFPLLIVLVVRMSALAYFGAYQGVFAYFGLWDLGALFKAVTVSAVLSGGLTFFVGLQSYPRSVFVIDWAVILLFLAGGRYILRAWTRQRGQQPRRRRQRALVVGAGVGGEQISRTLLEDPLCPYRPVGFIDELPERWGSMIHGIPVLGGATELPLAVAAKRIKAVFVCLSDLSDNGAREMVEGCERAGVEYRIVPTLSDLLNGKMPAEQAEAAPSAGVVAAGQSNKVLA